MLTLHRPIVRLDLPEAEGNNVNGQLAWDLRVLVHACFLRPDGASQTQDVPRMRGSSNFLNQLFFLPFRQFARRLSGGLVAL